MKRLSSILFLFILLFNFWGYRFMIDCLQQQHYVNFANQLDKDQYDENELISIKTSLNLPYYTSSATYERAYGSINVNGVDYEYVKRRVYNDTLELLCLPNKAKTQLQSVKNQFFKFSVEDQNTQPNKKNHNILKSGLPDYVQDMSMKLQIPNTEASRKFSSFNTSFILPGHVLRQERPPQAMQFFM